MRFKYGYFIIILFFSAQCLGQSTIKEYIKSHTTKVNTISPDSTNYADLDSLGQAIGDAHIVMLGEQDHGDAPTFLAKTRIIKYLHEKKGFDVLAFESDFFALNKGWDKLPKNTPAIDTFLKKNIFPIWTYCDACQDLFYKYVPSTFSTKNPLQISGFDNQLILNYTCRNLYLELDSVLKILNISTIPVADSLKHVWTDFIKYRQLTTFYRINFNLSNNNLLSIKKQLVAKLGRDDFWVLTVDNLIHWQKEKYYDEKEEAHPSLSYLDSTNNVRDSQMAANLQWLYKVKYPHHKIIVWAHSAHISKYAGHYPFDYFNHRINMGTIFTRDTDLMKKTYVLGFTSYKGNTGRVTANKPYKVGPTRKNGFERWIPNSYKYSFTDFKKYNIYTPVNSETFWMKGSTLTGLHYGQKAEWNKIFDGVFFIRDMYPCKVVY